MSSQPADGRAAWAVEYTTETHSGVKWFSRRGEAEEWAAEQRELYGAVTLVVPPTP